ncbi:MAG: tRNA (adenosine(37)-N6)-dimethylallyltransferase MiaA [Bacteroidales bacterium]|nr:tRNA (adenosine(37)-N6)-dimethylallyltransferase MiaA [Bacteroidales bacterium]
MPPLLTILGPTACGKTHIAVEVAYRLDGEIISADSRQVFRRMDIGTGKDLMEYRIHDTEIPYHLIDICEPGYEYSAGEFYRDFWRVYDLLQTKGKTPVLCGGTGLYIESVLLQYPFAFVPENTELRQRLSSQSDEQLTQLLQTYIKLHNHTDTESHDRLLRAIEIQEYQKHHPLELRTDFKYVTFGITYPRETIMKRIRQRLEERLESGMIDEVKSLIDNGVSPERLQRYGLEYRYVTQYLQKQLTYSQMLELLNIAIRQFAKRQMTWFRHMEKSKGISINWINPDMDFEEKVSLIIETYKSYTY